jgi:hypothetical protein
MQCDAQRASGPGYSDATTDVVALYIAIISIAAEA